MIAGAPNHDMMHNFNCYSIICRKPFYHLTHSHLEVCLWPYSRRHGRKWGFFPFVKIFNWVSRVVVMVMHQLTRRKMKRIEQNMNWCKFIAQCNVFSSQYSKFSDSVSKNIQDLKLLKANRKVSWQQKSFPWKHFWIFAWVTQWKQNFYCT